MGPAERTIKGAEGAGALIRLEAARIPWGLTITAAALQLPVTASLLRPSTLRIDGQQSTAHEEACLHLQGDD